MSLILSSDKTDFVTTFPSPLILEGEHELALVNLETYHSIPNVEEGASDTFSYSVDGGIRWIKITIPEGSYELDEIERFIYDKLKRKRHWDETNDVSFILVKGNLNTLKCELSITDRRFEVDFSPLTSIGKILGFEPKKYEFGHHVGTNTVNILNVNSILVHCDLISGSYVGGQAQPTLYSFFPNSAPGFKITVSPHNLIYLPVTKNVVHSIRVWLTDQADRPLNLRGETLTMRLHLRKKIN